MNASARMTTPESNNISKQQIDAPPAVNEKIPFLDFAKGYAILSIVVYHSLQRLDLPPLAQQAIGFGGTGVHLFFLLSGFGLSLSASRLTTHHSPLTTFYRRRFTKVWLPYVLALSLSLAAALAFDLFPDRWDAWVAGAGLYQMFVERYITSFGGHFWFISAILQFYLIFPFLERAQARFAHPWYFFAVALGLSMLWWLVVFLLGKGDLRSWNSFFLQFLWEFSLGMVLAGQLKKQQPGTHKMRLQADFWHYSWWQALATGVICTAAMIFMVLQLGAAGKIFNDIPALIGYTALCVFVYQMSRQYMPSVERFLIWAGGFSYSIYLIHVLVLDLYLRSLQAAGWIVNLPMLLLFLPLAILAGRIFEPLSKRWVKLFS